MSDSDTNVIVFPKPKTRNTLPQSEEEIFERVVSSRFKFINGVVEQAMEALTKELELFDVDTMDVEYAKHYRFLMDAVEAFVCKTGEVPHRFDEYIEKTYRVGFSPDGDVQTWTVDNLSE